MIDINNLWEFVDKKFEEALTHVSYSTWIQTAKAHEIKGNQISLILPSELHREYWVNNLIPKFNAFVYEYSGEELIPILLLEKDLIAEEENKASQAQAHPVNQGRTTSNSVPLNDKYVFDTFVIGKGNQMAHAAALVVAEEPGTIYNPLFFYGGVGLGKTHLMHAIGHQLLELRPNAKVKYVTSESFANDFINSIRNRTQEEFRNEYRSADLLLVDDIQFFADKEGTQEEFFHTFNSLYDQRKQIVLTSDRLPNEIPKLQERLVSRFAWGLSVDITPPDLETRIAILRNKANAENLEIPNDTLSYIAGQIDSNVRELEGALLRVQAYATMGQKEITTSLAADALKSMLPEDKKGAVTIDQIIKTVAKYYGITVEDILGRKRVRNIVLPRQIAMYLSRELTGESFPKIGKEFGGKDHSTVLHSCDKIEEQMASDSQLKNEVQELRDSLT